MHANIHICGLGWGTMQCVSVKQVPHTAPHTHTLHMQGEALQLTLSMDHIHPLHMRGEAPQLTPTTRTHIHPRHTQGEALQLTLFHLPHQTQ